jgi:hypothetical protein
MAETFNFCPNGQVPETLPRELTSAMTMNGWTFVSKPTTPYVRKFRVKLHGLRWFLNTNGLYDVASSQDVNAKLLEEFYERHETWNPFNWVHPHRGTMLVRFASPVIVPAALPASGGFIEPVEVNFVHHNPGY